MVASTFTDCVHNSWRFYLQALPKWGVLSPLQHIFNLLRLFPGSEHYLPGKSFALSSAPAVLVTKTGSCFPVVIVAIMQNNTWMTHTTKQLPVPEVHSQEPAVTILVHLDNEVDVSCIAVHFIHGTIALLSGNFQGVVLVSYRRWLTILWRFIIVNAC